MSLNQSQNSFLKKNLKMNLIYLAFSMLALSLSANHSYAQVPPAAPTMDDLFRGKAHFEFVNEIEFNKIVKPNSPQNPFLMEMNTSQLFVRNGIWYAVNRQAEFDVKNGQVDHSHAGCVNQSRLRTSIRSSRDQGKTWSDFAVVATPENAPSFSDCFVTDGSMLYDQDQNIWHFIAQCFGSDGRGWSLCHYTRSGNDPMGSFTPNSRNPVVRGGQLWKSICQGRKACTPNTFDEGTPELVMKKDGYFYVTFHGYNGKNGYRGIAKTTDFSTWITSGGDLPGDTMLAPQDCNKWNETWKDGSCIGFGHARVFFEKDYIYQFAEASDVNLGCSAGQKWELGLLRAKSWAPSSQWENFSGNPFVKAIAPWNKTGCVIQYQNIYRDGDNIFVMFGHDSQHGFYPNLIYKLVPGPGPSIVVTDTEQVLPAKPSPTVACNADTFLGSTSVDDQIRFSFCLMLSRQPSNEEVQFWKTKFVNAKMTTPSLLKTWAFQNAEFAAATPLNSLSDKDFVVRIYQLFLRRTPSADEIAFQTGALLKKQINRIDMVGSFVGSPEFAGLLKTKWRLL